MTKFKTALLASAWILASGPALAQEAKAERPLIFQHSDVKMNDYPGDPGKWGMKAAILFGDPRGDFYAERLSYPPNVMGTPHSHTSDRVVLVLDGTWYVGEGVSGDPTKTVAVRAGGTVFQPKGQIHYDGSRGEPATVQIVTMGPGGVTRVTPGEPSFRRIE